MISKCPECGRSYPTHHGSICKLCAAKSNPAAASAQVTAPEPALTAAVPEKKEAAPAANVPPKVQAQPPVQDFGFNPYLGASQQQASSSSQPATASAKEGVVEGTSSKPKVCPFCDYENDPTDVFCRSCEKMLIKYTEGKRFTDYKLSDLKGTIPDQLAKLKKIGIETSLKLLDRGSSPTKRKTLSIKTGISETFIQRLVHQADLLRLNSVQPEQAFLLETIGINTLKMLERKNAKEIVEIMNKQKTLLHSKKIMVIPGEKTTKQWIDDLKEVERVVT